MHSHQYSITERIRIQLIHGASGALRNGEAVLPVLLTVKEVADRLGTTESAIYAQIYRGRLPAMKIAPRLVRIRESDLELRLNPAGRELTVAEVARYLQLSTSEVYWLIRNGRLRALVRGRIGRRILERDLMDYVDARPPVAISAQSRLPFADSAGR